MHMNVYIYARIHRVLSRILIMHVYAENNFFIASCVLYFQSYLFEREGQG